MNRVSENQKTGFKACGIYPFNHTAVLEKIPAANPMLQVLNHDPNDKPPVTTADTSSQRMFVEYLSKHCFSLQYGTPARGRGKRTKVVPGRSITEDIFAHGKSTENPNNPNDPPPVKQERGRPKNMESAPRSKH